MVSQLTWTHKRKADEEALLARTTKPKTQCSWKGAPLTMQFNGRTFSGAEYSWPAFSGRPTITLLKDEFSPVGWFKAYDYAFDYSVARQKDNSEGPTKEGRYWINASATNCKTNAKRHNPNNPFNFAYPAWGDYSWHLMPYPSNDMSGNDGPRYGFFIHGGSVPGSAGCIDLLHNDSSFYNSVVSKVGMADGESSCYIDIEVRYAVEVFHYEYSTYQSLFPYPLN